MNPGLAKVHYGQDNRQSGEFQTRRGSVHFQTTMWRRIDDAKRGSRDALDGILSTYRPPLLDYLKSRGLTEHDAEDVVQQVCLAISQPSFLEDADRAKGRFRTLLLRVTQYVMASEFRKQQRQKRGGGVRVLSLEEIQDVATSPAEEERFNEFWMKRLIAAALGRLRDTSTGLKVPYHQVLEMKFLEGRSNEEIASQLGCKIHDVENHVYQGKIRLRECLKVLVRETCSSPEEHDEETRLLIRHGF